MTRINLGSGGNTEEGWDNLDKITYWGATYYDFDESLLSQYADSSCEELRVWGCLHEFKTDLITSMNEFFRVLKNDGILDIKVAVVDNGFGMFRDPIARWHWHSAWVEYFTDYEPGRRRGGVGLGFKGLFHVISNEVGGEVHHVILRTIK